MLKDDVMNSTLYAGLDLIDHGMGPPLNLSGGLLNQNN
jgi:hypothetical protein